MTAWVPRIWHSHRPFVVLAVLALVTEIIYLLDFLWPFPLLAHYHSDADMAHITGYGVGGFLAFVFGFCALFALMGGAVWIVRNFLPGKGSVAAIVVPAAVFVTTLVFVYPVTAIDLFNYVSESRILVHYHQNPMFVPPMRFPHDPIMVLSGGWYGSTSPYGPVAILADALPDLVAGGSLLWNLLLLKLFFGGLLILEALFIYRILLRVSAPLALSGAVLIAWNPLLLFEVAANGHNDIVMLILATLGLLALVEAQPIMGIALIGLSSLVKFATLPLLPLAVIFVISRPGKPLNRLAAAVGGLGVAVLLVIAAYVPFWRGFDTLSRAMRESGFGLQSFGAAVPVAVPALSTGAATALGRILFALPYLYACYLATKDPPEFLKGCCLAMTGFLALAVGSVKIWYLSWPAVLAALSSTRIRVAITLAALGASLSAAFFSYVSSWLSNTGADFRAINAWAYLMAFAPVALLLFPKAFRDSPPGLGRIAAAHQGHEAAVSHEPIPSTVSGD